MIGASNNCTTIARNIVRDDHSRVVTSARSPHQITHQVDVTLCASHAIALDQSARTSRSCFAAPTAIATHDQ